MSTITIQVSAPELIDAINNLAKAQMAAAEALNRLAHSPTTVSATANVPTNGTGMQVANAPRPNMPAPAYIDPQYNIPARMPQQQAPNYMGQPKPPAQPGTLQAEMQPARANPQGAQGISFEEIVTAVASLMGAGKYVPIAELLGKFGVQALHQLPKEYFGTFAAALRQMGAQI